MVRHVLLIRFKDTASDNDIDAVLTGFMRIPAQIDGVVDVEWGENDSPEHKNGSYTHCVLMTFIDDEARRRYLPHPAHAQLKALFLPVLRDILIVDYRTDSARPGHALVR